MLPRCRVSNRLWCLHCKTPPSSSLQRRAHWWGSWSYFKEGHHCLVLPRLQSPQQGSIRHRNCWRNHYSWSCWTRNRMGVQTICQIWCSVKKTKQKKRQIKLRRIHYCPTASSFAVSVVSVAGIWNSCSGWAAGGYSNVCSVSVCSPW